jgi:hypothetical protein
MGNVFNSVLRSPITKDGTYEWDPLLSGYFFFQFVRVPKVLEANSATFVKQSLALCTAVTLPDVNIGTVERIGLGGVKTVVPTALDQTTTFEFRFVEVVRSDNSPPLIQYLAQWHNSIRNHFAGVADPEAGASMNLYKAVAVFIACDPAISSLAFGVKLFGVWPTVLPYSGYTADVATNDVVEFTQTLSVDRAVQVDLTDPDANALFSYVQERISEYRGQVPFTK